MPTVIETDEGMMPFQEWFVQRRWQPTVRAVHLPDTARATPQVVQALRQADVVIIAPSNPFVSIEPILNAYPIRPILADECGCVIGISPVIGGQAVKGPTAAMMHAWEMAVTPATIAGRYADLLTGWVYDQQDSHITHPADLPVLATQTWMRTPADRIALAREILHFSQLPTPV
jgi:LPPG:FO 2-phospho-L-lactate transferase